MSEPITLYCTANHQYGGRIFWLGDSVALTAPSTVREFLASGNWSYTPPDEPQTAPDDDAQTPVDVPATPPAVKRGRSKKQHA